MTFTTINDAVTMPGGEGMLLAGRYRIVRQLGQGGMGSVWLAEDTQLDNKQFAIKMLPSILVSNKRAYRQLKDEALVAMKLTHPNIVTLRAFEENNGNPFLVMDYIDGQTLDDCLAEKGNLSEDEVIKLLKPIAAALDYAHDKGIVHRDVKPGNVMIAKDGMPYVLDFGISREIQETMTRVTGKLSSGTLLYMSPEQLNGEKPTSAQDIYSFAAMAYECLKGEPPFSRGQIEYQILNVKPAPLPNGVKLSASIMRGLSKEPRNRPDSCAAVLLVVSAAKPSPRMRVQASAPLRRISPPAVASPQVPRKSNIAEIIIPIVFILSALMVFGGVMWCLSSGSKLSVAKLNGKAIFPKIEMSEVARVELGDKLKLAAGEKGWVVETYHNYPADHAKLTENLLKLTELKVGQVARGKKLESTDALTLKDASGKKLAELQLGEKHAKWGHGRYATFAGETVLVSDSLDAFGSDGKSWVDTKIVDTPWISFNDIAEGVSEEELGFVTGVVAKVTIAGDTNRVATIGNKVKDGSDRYFKLDNSEWVYIVPEYSVDKLLLKIPPQGKK